MKFIIVFSLICIIVSMVNIFLFRFLPMSFFQLVGLFLISIATFSISMKYNDKQEKLKRGKQL